MEEIVFNVERDEESSSFVASWDEPGGKGGITTQGHDLSELQAMVTQKPCYVISTRGPLRSASGFILSVNPVLATA